MSNQPQNQITSSVLDKLGMALGCVTGFILTMPLYDVSYHYFYQFALRYSHYQYTFFWSALWVCCLFFFILTLVWFVLNTMVNVMKGFFFIIAVIFSKVGR